ncbi:decarboxylase [Sneathiella sp. P13V-1]|uniref:malonyl-CoA decarboxylase n=1 Tax=Sneathiella sp. P13V-1 TaxID=2697366 RepID=UPI00187B28EF|nr:malonyl-CoA decarboxylase [Sneathiella sp. P13V-1]MBE7637799.1 decarboxylase [Sneathiella sp. P13V-1]
MKQTLVGQFFNSIADAGRELLDRGAGKSRSHTIEGVCRDLMTQKGEASGMALAREVVGLWHKAEDDQRLAFMEFLLKEVSLDSEKVDEAVKAYESDKSFENRRALAAALEAPRQELMRRINFAPGGTAAIVDMRKFLVSYLRKKPELRAVDADMQHLLVSWFNRGFLEIEEINWKTPAVVLEKLIKYEAVHEITGWDDLRRRLDQDRRCFAFFHPALPEEPLIFVEVALVKGLAAAVQPLLDLEGERLDPTKADTAIFYSISNCQEGLKGISFGNFLIKQVVSELSAELPNLKHFSTLSPIPGFMKWFAEFEGRTGRLSKDEIDNVKKEMLDKDWFNKEEVSSKIKEPLEQLVAHYLVNEKSRNRPLDPVSRFHLGNGARLERINWLGDISENGMKQSAGLLVNYYYSLKDIERNHEAYINDRQVVASSSILSLAKDN